MLCLLLFLISFMTGLIPPDTIARTELSGVGKWGTVVTAVLSMIAVAVAGFAMMPFIGYAETIVAIPVINGGIVATQMMGFPATYLVALEVAQAAAETEEERKVIMDAIKPKYLVGGLSTVTSLSVIMAGILENVL